MSRRRFAGGAAPTGEHAVDAVVFDVGETLVDDTSAYAAWAECRLLRLPAAAHAPPAVRLCGEAGPVGRQSGAHEDLGAITWA